MVACTLIDLNDLFSIGNKRDRGQPVWSGMKRRPTAILAADMVRYSRLMGEDEEGTLARLKSYREIIDSLISPHYGRVFGSAGNSVIAEFTSPVEAVRCATEIQ